MAKTKKKEKEAQEAEQALPEQAPEQPSGQAQKQPPALPKQSNILLNVLTILLVVLGIGEVALLGFVGFQAFRGVQAKNRYEAQQAGTEQDDPQQPSGSHYLGPGLQIENGVVVWRSEDSPLGGVGSSSSSAPAQTDSGDETRLANMTVPRIGYRLADEDEPVIQ